MILLDVLFPVFGIGCIYLWLQIESRSQKRDMELVVYVFAYVLLSWVYVFVYGLGCLAANLCDETRAYRSVLRFGVLGLLVIVIYGRVTFLSLFDFAFLYELPLRKLLTSIVLEAEFSKGNASVTNID